MSIFYDSYVVVTISFTLFMLILGYYGVHKLILDQLDKRAERIRSELDEARRLREEAQAAFAGFERKQKEVAAQAGELRAAPARGQDPGRRDRRACPRRGN